MPRINRSSTPRLRSFFVQVAIPSLGVAGCASFPTDGSFDSPDGDEQDARVAVDASSEASRSDGYSGHVRDAAVDHRAHEHDAPSADVGAVRLDAGPAAEIGAPDAGQGDTSTPLPPPDASCVSFTQIQNGQEWPDVCEFDPSSPLHRPLPDNPQQLMSNQAQMIATLYPSPQTGNSMQVVFDTNLGDCAENCDVGSPAYLASSSDPSVTFSGMSCGADVNDSSGCPGGLYAPVTWQGRIPSAAGIEPASDGHLTVIQPDGTAYDGWLCSPKGHTWADGDTVSCNTLAVTNITTGTGFENGSATSGNSAVISPARVAELENGFNRMVRIQTACVSGNPVFPGTGQAEVCTNTSSAPPIGARLQVIDTPSQIGQMSLTSMEKNLLIAGHTYGWVIWDTYGGDPGGAGIDLESTIQFTSFGQMPPMRQLIQSTPGWSQNDPANDSWVFQGNSWAPFTDGWAAHLRIVDPCYSALTNPCTE